jgi:hypothetical protein
MRRLLLAMTMLMVAVGAAGQNAPVTVNVDAGANRHRISPNVYGLAFATSAQLSDLNVLLNRSGGNAETRYNWQANASNRAADYYFESIGETSAVAGEHGDTFIAESHAAGAEPMLTVPIIGWVAKLGNNRAKLASFSVAKYGAQQSTDFWMPDAGNGVYPNGSLVTGNDPNDANLPADALFQEAWVQHLVGKWGLSGSGGVRYYLLDNEHSIWHSSHRDVHPIGATMDEVYGKMLDHAQRIKEADPNALVLGPEEWGWSGYLLSGYDQQWGAAHGWSGYPDRAAHGNADYLPWLLQQFQLYEITHGKRMLDVFSVHYYPQGGELGNDTSTAMQQRRNRSTRSLWDPGYVDESWIADTVRLVPRLREWAETYYAGTPIGLTEYNWGAEGHMNGATAQADILGILGREGIDLATRWTTPATGSPVYNAIKLYRNYDGAQSAFGDLSISASGPNPDSVAAFAAIRSSDRAVTVMIVSKYLTGTTAVTVSLSNYTTSGTVAARWQLAAGTITHPSDATLSGGSVSVTVPAQSVTLLVIPGTTDVAAPTITLASPVTAANNQVTFTGTAADETGVARVTYTLAGATVGTGTATGTTSWSAPIHCNTGLTRVTFSAYDAIGNRTSVSTQVATNQWQPGTPAGRRRIASP